MRVIQLFDSIQGEGIQTGLPATFIRLSGCNLACSFCDTKWNIEGVEMTADQIVNACHQRLVIITGGEPLLHQEQMFPLLAGLRLRSKTIALETNGTIAISEKLLGFFNSISMSPKTPRNLVKLKQCHSLKLLYPYLKGCSPKDYRGFSFTQGFIQPIMGIEGSMAAAVKEVLSINSPFWKLGPQLHKLVEVL